jgi:hypothetical protein
MPAALLGGVVLTGVVAPQSATTSAPAATKAESQEIRT